MSSVTRRADLIKTTFTDPTLVVDRLQNNDALGYARDLLAPFAFTSLLAPLLLVPAIPQFFANILTNLNFFWSIQFHYAAIIVAFVALSSIDGVARLKSLPVRRFAVGAVAAAALATSVAWGMSPISTQYRNGYWALYANPRQAEFDAAVDAVPSDAAVSATYNIVPHLSHREQIYTFPNPWFPLNWGVAGVAPDDPDHDHVPAEVDWIVVDRTTHVPDGREEQLIDSLLESGEFVVVSDESGILVARRDEEPAESRRNVGLSDSRRRRQRIDAGTVRCQRFAVRAGLDPAGDDDVVLLEDDLELAVVGDQRVDERRLSRVDRAVSLVVREVEGDVLDLRGAGELVAVRAAVPPVGGPERVRPVVGLAPAGEMGSDVERRGHRRVLGDHVNGLSQRLGVGVIAAPHAIGVADRRRRPRNAGDVGTGEQPQPDAARAGG